MTHRELSATVLLTYCHLDLFGTCWDARFNDNCPQVTSNKQ